MVGWASQIIKIKKYHLVNAHQWLNLNDGGQIFIFKCCCSKLFFTHSTVNVCAIAN